MLADDSVHEASGTHTGRAKIAWLSPFPPQRSGIANYSYWLIKALSAELDIDLFSNEQLTPELAANFVVRPLSAFPARFRDYDDVIYHLGNHAVFHKRIYELAWQHPATIVLHDYNLSGFMREAFYPQHLYRQAMLRVQLKHNEVSERQAAMSHAIVDRSRKVIVHHRWARNQFADHPRVEVIPHFARINYTPTELDIARFKQQFELRSDHFVITCLGFVNLNKLPALQIDVVKRLLGEGYPVHLVFAGEPAPDVLDLLIKSKLDGYSKNVICTGYLNERDYFSAIFASDVIINLRNPTMGESSGTLAHALAAGRPTIVSNVNQYREFPDTVCWKIDHGKDKAELLFQYLTALLSERNLRTRMSANATDFTSRVLSLEKVAAQWLQLIFKGLNQ
jgi:glycosyltransferase involved in cell wall biosynthesis